MKHPHDLKAGFLFSDDDNHYVGTFLTDTPQKSQAEED